MTKTCAGCGAPLEGRRDWLHEAICEFSPPQGPIATNIGDMHQATSDLLGVLACHVRVLTQALGQYADRERWSATAQVEGSIQVRNLYSGAFGPGMMDGGAYARSILAGTTQEQLNAVQRVAKVLNEIEHRLLCVEEM